MRLGDHLVDGEFLERPNRYLAKVRIGGQIVPAHVPDPGRLPGLMVPGHAARLIHNPSPTRKTEYTLALVRHGSIWVSVFPAFANRLIGDALEHRTINYLAGYKNFKTEAKKDHSRFDFYLEYENARAYVEVKSVSLVEDGVGKFPDAPTERGRKHLRELTALRKQGFRSIVLFVSQRSDTQYITGNDAIDPKFGDSLRAARAAGVELYGFNCKVTKSSVSLDRQVEVKV